MISRIYPDYGSPGSPNLDPYYLSPKEEKEMENRPLAEYTADFEDDVTKAVAALLQYGESHEEILNRLVLPKINSVENTKRLLAYQTALQHWLKIGYSYNTARALAAVKHGQDEHVREWARWRMQSTTNLRFEDMI